MKNNTHDLVLAGLLGAVGVILPFVTSHAYGVPGNVLLPMHLPVFLIGFLCGPLYGAIGGAVIPFVSSLLTGMPPFFPMMPIMAGELLTYGLVSGLLFRNKRLSIYPTLLISMVCGRAVYGLIFAALATANSGHLRALSVAAAFVQGLPGIALQLVLIPAIVAFVTRRLGLSIPVADEEKAVAEARRMIAGGDVSFVVIRNGEIVHSADGRGVRPVIQLLKTNAELLRGATVVDKIIGKAAAMLLTLGGARRIYGELMSVSAFDYLTPRGIKAEYGRKIDIVSNREGNGICPLERSVKDVDDPQEAYEILQQTIAKLMAKAS